MKKFKLIADFEKEEQFLNDMARKGYHLKKYNSLGMYTFINAEPQNLSYRVDYRTFANNVQFEEYSTLCSKNDMIIDHPTKAGFVVFIK